MSAAFAQTGLPVPAPVASPPEQVAGDKAEPDGFTLLHQAQQALDAFEVETSEKLGRRALEIIVNESGGEEHPAVAQALLLLGRTLQRQERPAEAVETLVRAQALLDSTAGPDSPLAVAALPDLLEARHRMGQHAEAVALADRLLKSLAAAFEPDEARLLETERRRGQVLLALGRLDEAQVALAASQQRAVKVFGEGSPVFARLQSDIEQVSRKRGGPVVPRFVGNLGSTKRLAFEGNVSFPAAALIKGLLQNPPFFRASHPSAPLADYLTVTRSALTEGYQAAGFRDVKVTVDYDAVAEMIRARMVEGQRFRRSAIRIEGVKRMDPEALRRTLVSGAKELEDDELSQIEEAVKGIGQTQKGVTSPSTIMVDQVAGISAQGSNLADNSLSPEDQGRKAAEMLKDFTQKQLPFTAAVAAVWEADKSPSFASGAQDALRSSLSGHFLHHGFPQAKCETAFETDDASGQVTLVVRVTDEGPPARLGRIAVTGLKLNTKAGILQFLGLKEGQALLPDTLRTAKLALWNSGRFRRFSLAGTLREAGKPEVDLALDGLELENAPPVDQPLPPELDAMVRCARFLSSLERTGQDFVLDGLDFMDVISGTKDEKEKSGPKSQEMAGSNMSLAFSPAGGASWRIDIPKLSTRMLLTADRQFLQFTSDVGGLQVAWRVPTPGGVAFGVSLLLDADSADKEVSFNFWLKGASREAETPFHSSLVVAPALMLKHGLESTSRFERSGGVMKVTLDSGELVIDEGSGQLIEWKLGDSAMNARFLQASGEVARAEGEGLKMWDLTPAAQKVELSGEIVYGLVAMVALGQFDAGSERDKTAEPDWSWIGGKSTPEAVAAVQSAVKLAGSIDGIVRRIFAGMEPITLEGKAMEEVFHVPFDASSILQGNSLIRMMGPGLVAMADEFLPEGSWGQRLAREIAYASGGQPAISAKSFEEIAADPALGPVSGLLAAQTLQKFSQEEAAVHFRRRAVVLTRKEHFRRDWMPLTQGDGFGPELLRSAVTQVAALTPGELDALNGLLPAMVSTILKSTVAGLQEKKDLPIAEQIGPVMDLLWDMGLGVYVRAAARSDLPMPEPVVDPAEVAAVVNGVPVSRRVVDSLLHTGTFFNHVPAPERPDRAPPLNAAGSATESLIQIELAGQFFQKMKGTFKEEAIDQIYQQLVDQAGGEKGLLAAYGLRVGEIKKLLQDREISGYVVGEIRKRIESPSDAEVDAMEESWRQDQAREYHLHTINFPPGASLPDRLNWAFGLRGLVDPSVPFNVFMHASSGTASTSRLAGSCFGWPAREAMEEPIRSAITKLKTGETTPPLILPNGNVALFSLEEVRGGDPAKVKANRDLIRASLLEQRQNKAMEEWFTKARAQSRIRLIDLPEEGTVNKDNNSPVEDLARKASFIPAVEVMKLFASLRDGRLEDAGKALDEIESLQLPDAISYSQLAGALNSKNQPVLAQRAARAGTELDREHAGSWNELGRALLLQGKPHTEEAAAAFRSALKLKPEFREAHRNLGLALEQQGKLDEAIVSWRTAVKLLPDFPEAWTDLVRGLKASGKVEEAEAAAAQAPRPNEKSAE